MKFAYAGPGAPKGIPAEVAGSILASIAERDGGIRPGVVVEEARPDDAPLHPAFEWDDTVAAEHYRVDQARRLVRAVVMVSEPDRGETIPTLRAFVSVHEQDGAPQSRFYRPTMDVLADPLAGEQLKARLRNELAAMRQRYMDVLAADASLREAFDLVDERASA